MMTRNSQYFMGNSLKFCDISVNFCKLNYPFQERIKQLHHRIEGFPELLFNKRDLTVIKYGVLWEISGKFREKLFFIIFSNSVMFNHITDEKNRFFRRKSLIWLGECEVCWHCCCHRHPLLLLS